MSDAAVVKHDNASSFAALHVKQELKWLSQRDVLPTEKTVLWY